VQSVPSTALQLAPPEEGWLHVPSDAPASVATVQTPPQQSSPDWQTSPFCSQNEETAHTPAWQRPEQQSDALAHVLPSVVHPPGFNVAHEPAEHAPLQQPPFVVQAFPFDVHAGKLQTPPLQSPLQQSVADMQAAPSLRQLAPSPPKTPASLVPFPESTPEPDSIPVPPSSVAPSADMPSSTVPSVLPSTAIRGEELPPHAGAPRPATRHAATAARKKATEGLVMGIPARARRAVLRSKRVQHPLRHFNWSPELPAERSAWSVE
jgi:hypothetical protein